MSRRIIKAKKCYRVEQQVPRVEIRKAKEIPRGKAWMGVGKPFEYKEDAEKLMRRAKKQGKVRLRKGFYQEVSGKLRVRNIC